MLTDKIDNLTAKISHLNDRLDKRNQYIMTLEKRLEAVEANYDRLEQYSRRSNFRFHGIKESDNDDTTAKVMAIVNDTVAITYDTVNSDIDTSHRLWPKPASGERPKPVIVRFTCERLRDVVPRARRRVRDLGSVIYINEDLRQRRAKRASKARQLKKEHNFADCWTYNGRVMINTVWNVVRELRTNLDLNKY